MNNISCWKCTCSTTLPFTRQSHFICYWKNGTLFITGISMRLHEWDVMFLWIGPTKSNKPLSTSKNGALWPKRKQNPKTPNTLQARDGWPDGKWHCAFYQQPAIPWLEANKMYLNSCKCNGKRQALCQWKSAKASIIPAGKVASKEQKKPHTAVKWVAAECFVFGNRACFEYYTFRPAAPAEQMNGKVIV